MQSPPDSLAGSDLAHWHLLMSINQPLKLWDWPRIHAAAATLQPAERLGFRWSVQWLRRTLRPAERPKPSELPSHKYIIRLYEPLPSNAVEKFAATGFETGVESLRAKIQTNNERNRLVNKAIEEIVAEVLEIVIKECRGEAEFKNFDEFERAALALSNELGAVSEEFDDERLRHAVRTVQMHASLIGDSHKIFAVSDRGSLQVCALLSHFVFVNKQQLMDAITRAH